MFPKMDKAVVFTIALFALTTRTVVAIDCYQCVGTDPTNPFLCNEFLEDNQDLSPRGCDDVYGASYCIKHIGRFEVSTIKCFRCDSAQSIDCTDVLINDPENSFEAEECDDVFEAQYCIKSTALLGGIGTKRYCSALDLGNYCNYVQHLGDQLEYRSCVYTCSADGCNSSTSVAHSLALLCLPALLLANFLTR